MTSVADGADTAGRAIPMTDGVRDDHDRQTCGSQRHGDFPPRAAVGAMICAGCRDQAEKALVELPQLYDLCAYALDARPAKPQERVSGYRPHGIVLRDAVVDIRSDIVGVLAAWCGLVATERGVPGPDELSLPRLSTFVLIHFRWLVAHPAGADFTDELTALADRANTVLAPEPVAALSLGPCLRPGCGWNLRADEQPPKRIRCEAGHEWPPEQWLLLRDGSLGATAGGGE